MKPRARILLAVVVSACASTPACFLSRNSKAAQIPLPAPTPSTKPANPPPAGPPARAASPPAVSPAAPTIIPAEEPSSTTPANATTPTTIKPASPAATHRTKPVRHKKAGNHVPPQPGETVVTPAAPAAATSTSATAAPPTSPTQLGEILTPAQKADLIRNLDQSLAATRVSLSKVQGRSLTPDQAETARLVRSFEEQAESARQTDLSVAVQLARRAELLARDLASAMR